MVLEILLVSISVILGTISLNIYKGKKGMIRFISSLVLSLIYIPFKTINLFYEFIDYYLIVLVIFDVYLSLLLVPKKITKNITEYDYFELEKAYEDLKDDKEKLRERFLSTISLVDEGIVFYENNYHDVIMSDAAQIIFNHKPNDTIENHALYINPLDRDEYLMMIDKVSKRQNSYEIKYRVKNNDDYIWVLEKGHFIGVEKKRSIIAVVRSLDIKSYKKTSYIDVDNIYSVEKMYPMMKSLKEERKPYIFVIMELSNIPEINEKYGREIGNLLMNDYLKFIKAKYISDINKIFRVTGIRFSLIIDDYKVFEDFFKALSNQFSDLYTTKIQISTIKDTIKPNFGVVRVKDDNKANQSELINIARKELEKAKGFRKSYSIYGE